MMESIGIQSEIVLIPRHAFLRIKIPDSPKQYTQDDKYIYLDWTCETCEFGELPYQNFKNDFTILEI